MVGPRITAVALIIAGLAAAGAARAEIIDRVVAVVGSQVVTLSDLRATEAFALIPTAAQAGGTADPVACLVNRQLMLSEAERYSAPEPDPGAVDRRMLELRAGFATGAAYERALAMTAMSEERLRSLVADNLRIDAYVDQRFGAAAQPTADEVQRYYREHPAEFTRGGRLLAFENVQQEVQQKAGAERRQSLIADWLARLRRRGVASTLIDSGGR